MKKNSFEEVDAIEWNISNEKKYAILRWMSNELEVFEQNSEAMHTSKS
jgi:hypothetical protein